MAKYQAQFLTSEKFALGKFATERERERTIQFMSKLCISFRPMVATFSCVTLAEAVMRTLECEYAHEYYHQRRI